MDAAEIMIFVRDEARRLGMSQGKLSEATSRAPRVFAKTLCNVVAGHGVHFSTVQDFLRVVGYEITIQPIEEET